MTEEEARRVEEVFVTHQRYIEAVAARHAPSIDDVPDIVQTVCLRLCRSLRGFREKSEITTWLFRVTVNTARDHYQQRQRHQRSVDAFLEGRNDVIEDPDDCAIRGERVEALREAIVSLRANHRQALGNDFQQAGVLPSSIRVRKHRARLKLRRLLEGDPRLNR